MDAKSKSEESACYATFFFKRLIYLFGYTGLSRSLQDLHGGMWDL